jgi:F-type H+-transporting ATPase subunit delta
VIHSASRQALATLREHLSAVTNRFSTVDGLTGLSAELTQVVDLLINQPPLRRRLADPSTKPERRAGLAGQLLDGKLGTSSVQVVRDAVSLRWSSGWDLIDALEIIADEVLLAAAEQNGTLDTVEDELFRFGRIIDGDSRLSTLLDDYAADTGRRAELLRTLVVGKVDTITEMLLEHAVTSQRKRTLTHSVDALLDLAALRRNRSMARVISATELTAAQESRLAAELTEMYGRPITIRSAVDPRVRGGLVVRVEGEIIDGSITTRLANLRAALSG